MFDEERRILKLYTAGITVKRYHTVLGSVQQTIGEHSWGVAFLAHELFPTFPELIWAALTHDLSEILTGDIPAPAKWYSEEYAAGEKALQARFNRDYNLPGDENHAVLSRLKICDMLECALFSSAQVRSGNRHYSPVYTNAVRAVRERVEQAQLLDSEREPLCRFIEHMEQQHAEP